MADDLATVTALLERWRDAGTLGRMSTIVDATRAIRELPPERKRALAIEVAERVAPQLVPQITEERGDLTPQQVTALVDLLRRADGDQLDDLVTALRTGDVDPALRLADQALDVLAPPAPDEVGTPDDDPSDGPGPAAAATAAAGAAAGRSTALDETIDALDDVPDEPATATLGDELPDEAELREQARAKAEATQNRWRDTSPPPATMEPLDLDFGVSFALSEGELPDTTVEVVPTLLERADEPPPAAAPAPRQPAEPASDEEAPAVDEPARTVGADAVVTDVLDEPDGYRRRRAALAALRDGSLRDPADLATVLAQFARPTDRGWVAGAALDAGLLDPDTLDSLQLPPGAVARLRRRAPA